MLLEAKNISFRYGKGQFILRNIDLNVKSGERVGLVGPSGYGKSTLSKILAGYEKPVEGKVYLDGTEVPKKVYNPIQLIYQHPEKAINPRWKMRMVLEESGEIDEGLMYEAGIESEWLARYPRELSGGELQRFCVARALNKKTKFIIADEISTMLDVITQAQIWNLVLKEVKKRNLGMIVVTHNMALAEKVCTRVVDLRELNGQV